MPIVTSSFDTVQLGPIPVTTVSFVAMGVSTIMLGLVGYVLLRTRIGRATRAVSDNPALAAASGIDVDRIIRLVWTVAMGLAGLAGIFYALVVSNGIKWDTGLQILLLLFAAVTLGGLGTAFGALVGCARHRPRGRDGRAARGTRRPQVRRGAGHPHPAAAVQAPGPARSRRASRLRRD